MRLQKGEFGSASFAPEKVHWSAQRGTTRCSHACGSKRLQRIAQQSCQHGMPLDVAQSNSGKVELSPPARRACRKTAY